MTGKTEQIDHGRLGKAVLPAIVTLVAGLGAGLFAMRPDNVPDEPRGDNLVAPSSLAEAPRATPPVALVVPEFAAEAAVSPPAAAPARPPVAALTTAAGALPSPMKPAFDPAPEPLEAAAELPRIEQLPVIQPPAMAAPMAPALAVAAVPVVEPARLSPEVTPQTEPVSAAAASPKDNADIAVAQPLPVAGPIAETAAAPAPQLAIADWNYSLPEQAGSPGRNAFADSVGNAPITLVPSRAAQPATAATSRAATRTALAAPTGKASTALGNRKIAGAGFASALHGKGKYQFVGSEIEFQLPVVANGAPVGQLTLHVAPNQEVSLRLRELLSLFHDQIDPQVLTTLVASPSIESFVTFEKLRDAGIDIRYDAARDRIALSVEQP